VVKAIPADLAEQVCSVGIDVGATERLAAVFHRSLARRAAARLDAVQRPLVEELVRGTRRLAPAAVYSLYQEAGQDSLGQGAGNQGPGNQEAGDQRAGDQVFPSTAAGDHGSDVGADEVVGWLTGAGEVAPAAVYAGESAGGGVPLWLREGLQEVVRSLNWGEESVASVVTELPVPVSRSVELSRLALSRVWPAAWVEHNTLVHYLVFAEGPLRSATVQSTFGVVYAEVGEASDPLRMYELLLHETAHHSLALRERFTQFLKNPDAVGAHALRPDPRPLRGVLHAAFVMCRLVEGISRYRDVYPSGGPLDGCPVEERLEFARESLRSALAVLDGAADWTVDGRALRASMQQCVVGEGVTS
jgi:hypothetical protein